MYLPCDNPSLSPPSSHELSSLTEKNESLLLKYDVSSSERSPRLAAGNNNLQHSDLYFISHFSFFSTLLSYFLSRYINVIVPMSLSRYISHINIILLFFIILLATVTYIPQNI